MTTSPVMSVTDELVAELERAVSGDLYIDMHPSELRALLAERAELKRDAERYRWLRDHYHGFEHYRTMKHRPNALRDEIDAAMQK